SLGKGILQTEAGTECINFIAAVCINAVCVKRSLRLRKGMLNQYGQSDEIGILRIKSVDVYEQFTCNDPFITQLPGSYSFRFEFFVLVGCWHLPGSLKISKGCRIISILII